MHANHAQDIADSAAATPELAEPKPVMGLAGFPAADANMLLARLHSGGIGDLNQAIREISGDAPDHAARAA